MRLLDVEAAQWFQSLFSSTLRLLSRSLTMLTVEIKTEKVTAALFYLFLICIRAIVHISFRQSQKHLTLMNSNISACAGVGRGSLK